MTNVLNDVDPDTSKVYGPWVTMQVPLPDKLWLAPEVAEAKGGEYLFNAPNQIAGVSAGPLPFTSLNDLVKANRLALHTYAVRSNVFKARLEQRGLPTKVRREYALARLPRYVWVVEAIDHDLRIAGKPCVVGEALFDATSSDHEPNQVALHIHGIMWVQLTSGKYRFGVVGEAKPYGSGGVGPA